MYGLIGYPLGHSFSQRYFTDKFRLENISEEYGLFAIKDIGEIRQLVGKYPDLKGLNVTLPYKERIIPYLDSLSADSSAIGAVNVVNITYSECGGHPFLKGYNTDWEGFLYSLKPLLKNRDEVRKALVLGSGGASKGICYALERCGIKPQVVSRTRKPGCITYGDLCESVLLENMLIVNATPLGMFPNVNRCPEIPYEFVTAQHICYDLIYNPEVTEFMKRCAKQGAIVKNGLEMLYKQAELSWMIWNKH